MASKKCIYFVLLSLSALLLCSCAAFSDKNKNRPPVCREIVRKQIFSGNTQSQIRVWRDRAEQGRLAQDYKDQGCG